jgi:hypothetical protein
MNEKTQMATTITKLETENQVLKDEFLQLQKLICDSDILSKLFVQANWSILQNSLVAQQQDNTRIINAANQCSPPPAVPAVAMYMMVALFRQYFNNRPNMVNGPSAIHSMLPTVQVV